MEFERQVCTSAAQLRGAATGRFECLLKAGAPQIAIGRISLRANDRTPLSGEVDSLVMHARGKNYASEARGAATDEAFEAGDLDEVQACIIPENGPPRSVLDRTGFREERMLRSGAVIRDRTSTCSCSR